MSLSLSPLCHLVSPVQVPAGKDVTIQDVVRGEVTWNTDNLGDFVILRSNGLPVYNFCVAVDDALMGITHVLRAEEHLPNTLRQVRAGRGPCKGVIEQDEKDPTHNHPPPSFCVGPHA